jgi:hypothetical protein
MHAATAILLLSLGRLAAVEVVVPWTVAGPLPTVSVCPLQYGKAWAYAVEIDDSPTAMLTVVAPELEKYHFTTAPAGAAGGARLPFVGTGAVMVNMVSGGNGTFLTWEQLKELQARGWGIASHSYWHTGNHWDPTQALAPADFRRELYWSQAMFAALLGGGRCPIHFVYPNGDPGYGGAHGFSTTLPGGSGAHTVCAYGINRGPGANTLLGCKTG